MYFTIHTPLYPYEVMMQGIPNFLPRGYGTYINRRETIPASQTDCQYCLYYHSGKCSLEECQFLECKIANGTATVRQIMAAVFSAVTYPPFIGRLKQYIRESENKNMNYYGKKHESDFKQALERIDPNNLRVLSAVYLLTADTQLWRRVQNQVEKNGIRFDKMTLGSVDEKAYTLFCCAKDLYLGTKHITIGDLADEQLISPKMFGIICNALAIRRFGIGVLNQN
ncbi:MAG: hypothetical protein IJF78_06440 [Clostridia bacterium]|nr:hypothetical protein [Clostridia bacterium]